MHACISIHTTEQDLVKFQLGFGITPRAYIRTSHHPFKLRVFLLSIMVPTHPTVRAEAIKRHHLLHFTATAVAITLPDSHYGRLGVASSFDIGEKNPTPPPPILEKTTNPHRDWGK